MARGRGTKRGARGTGRPATKRAKQNPITAKVKELIKFLEDDEATEVPGPESCREGILAAAPHALGFGAAIDERHAMQAKVVTIVGEVLDASETKWVNRLKVATAAWENGKNEQATKDAALEATKGRLTAAKTAVDEAKAQLQTDIASENTARTNLKAATAEVDNFDSIQAGKEKEKEEYASLYKDVFLVLKVAEGDKKPEKAQLNSLTTKLRKLKVDDSLLSAVAPALSKKPPERGTFDDMVVSQVEDSMKQHVASLEDDLNNGAATKSRKEAEKDAAQDVMEKAEAKRAASVDTLKSAESKVTDIEAEEVQAKKSCEKQEEAVSDLDCTRLTEQCALDQCREVMKSFAYLRDRVAADTGEPAEAEAEPEAAEAEPEAVAADEPMSEEPVPAPAE